MPEDESTDELREQQLRKERSERTAAGLAPDEATAREHHRRAEKASYLREKLSERARSEAEAAEAERRAADAERPAAEAERRTDDPAR